MHYSLMISLAFLYNGNMSIIKEVSQKIHGGPKRNFTWMDAILLLFLMGYILAGINLTPFHGDESTYISMSEDYDRIVKDGDLHRVLYTPEGNGKQSTRLSIGSILVFSIGFARDLADIQGTGSRWLWGASWDENVAQG